MKTRSSIRTTLLIFSLVLILLGFWFSTTNAYTFIKGYMLFQTSQTQIGKSSEKPSKIHIKHSDQEETLYSVRPKKGENIGNLLIPKLNATLPIFHGTDEEELERGVGHFEKSVLPGEQDNAVLSGHRDTVFRKLGEVGKGDTLIVKTSAGTFTYKIRNVRIVDKDDRTVIVPKPRATLTVSTCYPFNFIGASPERYILVADLISQKLT
ncbi:class D sortase [Fictibacillus sp. 5RED26]|uniref:class D sortase n=1 Tax=unclassified Fictibacillus TaxID=2644029 RepID=UPI0018CFC735|nr:MULTISPECIES: class D sortase [unclassified Fictibacillus]MBH0156182.1 class D sortase [Fictibacillus sp. 5RED26]MBH0173340.1 class D sortase [Fictibacillus sp. 23RED33]